MDRIEARLEHWQGMIDEELGLSAVPLRKLARETADLSDILVGKHAAPCYMEREDFIRAYGAFYFSQSVARTAFVLEELLRLTDLPAPSQELRILDAGAGTGASLLAACDLLSSMGVPYRAEAVEQCGRAAGVLTSLVERAGLQDRVTVRNADVVRWRGGPYELVILSTTLSELICGGGGRMSLLDVRGAARSFYSLVGSPGALVVIEPSWRKGYTLLRDVARCLEQPPVLPCLGAAACGIEQKRDDWCHASLDLRLPEITRKVNQVLGHNLHYVKFTYGVFGRGLRPAAGGVRVISPVKRSKGKSLVRVCDGGRVSWAERLDRARTEANGDLDSCGYGDTVEFESRPLQGGVVRIEADHFFRRVGATDKKRGNPT